jgi:hypothetical protein
MMTAATLTQSLSDEASASHHPHALKRATPPQRLVLYCSNLLVLN